MNKINRKSLLKYPGGKAREIIKIRPFFPKDAHRFIDPFVGGGSVWLDSEYSYNLINDYSSDLINLYRSVKKEDFINFLKLYCEDLSQLVLSEKVINEISETKDMITIYDLVLEYGRNINISFPFLSHKFKLELPKYLKRKVNYLEKKGIISVQDTIDLLQTAVNGAYYNAVRSFYNSYNGQDSLRAAIYLYIREFCYSSMFRFSKSGNFNVPYGGKSYNNKNFKSHIDYYGSQFMSNKLKTTEIYNLDFEDFINKIKVVENDFIFLDPPYDSEFSTYDNNSFDKEEQIRLANLIKTLKCKWMLVIKNSELIRSLYPSNQFNYFDYSNRYSVNFKNRNIQNVKHLVITNY
ncbi:DNA adenine methylase [Apilactobacillus ozensis]|uniref:DNA adenine methylase n=1 Tax=Apilactobacillus ozensis TaxID=866801 RepID=UPI00200ACA0A|nr:DNA adenine methylase [Apilactobacillus ozensis]MCK8606983.1 DNA adenine methylase [Apilactobacillus ozensis]